MQGGLVGEIILCRIAVPSSENRAGERLSLVGFEPYDGADTDFVRRRRIEIENIRRGNIALQLHAAGGEKLVVFARPLVVGVLAQVSKLAGGFDCKLARWQLVLDDIFEFFAARLQAPWRNDQAAFL